MRVRGIILPLALLLALLVALAGPLWQSLPSTAAPDIPQGEEALAAIAPDTFGIAHVSAVNAQVPTYSATRYQQALAAGGTWNRWVFYWHEIEQTPNSYSYWPQDTVAAQDAANGFRYKVDAILMGTPGWAATSSVAAAAGATRPAPRVGERDYLLGAPTAMSAYSGPSPVTTPPQNLYASVFSDGSDVPGAGKAINSSNYWARFVYNTVSRFKDRVRHWEIWNEPDFYPTEKSNYFGFWSGSADQYFRLLKVGYLAAKSADPSAVVVMGGMAFWPEIVYQNRQPFTFFSRVLDLAKGDPYGAASNYYFDTTAWHWYSRSNQSYYKVQDTQGVLNSRGLGSKPIWINETGMPAWNDPAWPPGGTTWYPGSGTMTEQASYVMQSLAYALAAGVERSFVFQEYDDGNAEAYGLLRNTGPARPAYYAYQMATGYLAGTYSAALSGQGTAHLVTAYTTAGKRVVAAWNNSPTGTQVSIAARASSALLLGQPTEANPYGTQQTIAPGGGQYVITLPGATANYTGDPNHPDYIVGGVVALLVESGVPGPGTPTPVPSPTPVARPTGLVANGGFEQQPAFTGWNTTIGSVPPQLGGSAGDRYAILGKDYVLNPNLNGANSTLAQTLTLPANAQRLNLQFRYFLNTGQPEPGDPGDPYSYDKFEVLVFDQNGNRHDLLVDWAGKLWWAEQSLDLSAFRGQRVQIVFNVWQSEATSAYGTTASLDDVRLWPFATILPTVRKNSSG